MKKAILTVSFGTTYTDAAETSLARIGQELSERWGGLPVYEAYTSRRVIELLKEKGVFVDTVEEAAHRAADDGAKKLYVVVTHMIPGVEYQKMQQSLEPLRPLFRRLVVTSPVLGEPEDCVQAVRTLKRMLEFREDREYILMGHGTESDANIRYVQMNEAFIQEGLGNVRIASVEARPDLEDALEALEQSGKGKTVILHPFLVVAGDHARNDMAGKENSWAARLQEAGYRVETVVKGLGEYPAFRQIYASRLIRALEEEGRGAGCLYGVGVGPGDPELLTRKAIRTLQECSRIGVPAKAAKESTAYRIALTALPELKEKPVLEVEIPMTKDRKRLAACYEEGCRKLEEALDMGESVAFLNLGDPTVYGTYMEIHWRMRRDGYRAGIVSGVPSFCAVAAALERPLGAGAEEIHILPGSYGTGVGENYGGTRILMKSGSRLSMVKERLLELEEEGGVEMGAVTNCGMDGERVCRSIRELEDGAGYFTTILIRENEDGRWNNM